MAIYSCKNPWTCAENGWFSIATFDCRNGHPCSILRLHPIFPYFSHPHIHCSKDWFRGTFTRTPPIFHRKNHGFRLRFFLEPFHWHVDLFFFHVQTFLSPCPIRRHAPCSAEDLHGVTKSEVSLAQRGSQLHWATSHRLSVGDFDAAFMC